MLEVSLNEELSNGLGHFISNNELQAFTRKLLRGTQRAESRYAIISSKLYDMSQGERDRSTL